MVSSQNFPNRIEDFISAQVIGRGLDERTARAYRMDLEKFYFWLEEQEPQHMETVEDNQEKANRAETGWEAQMETYLEYLSGEKGLRYSTVYRKQRVLGYYLAYLVSRGVVEQSRPLRALRPQRESSIDTLLTKKEVEAFFHAIDREYEELDSDFRRRVCLRDQVMMELLFYHGLEISELLRLEVSDYNRKTATLTIRRKREKNRTEYLFSRALQKQMDEWLSEHVYFEHGGLYHNRMFLSKLGKPLSMKMVINIFDKYRVMAGIEKVCKPKDLKNSLGRYAEEVVREQG
ncbi:MAG: tyrosine-type recombinase/integrase [Lachnospiraceae bacterium]|jgi:integrase/recombinase XerD|nr:tyrosine-type recombinase/integrase [Lachnospiraceae bacterium]